MQQPFKPHFDVQLITGMDICTGPFQTHFDAELDFLNVRFGKSPVTCRIKQ